MSDGMIRSSGHTTSFSTGHPMREILARVLILKIVLLVFFAVVAARLVHIQVIETTRYQAIAKRQYESKVLLPAERGTIHDRNGRILVSNTAHVSLAADPGIVGGNAGAVADRFAAVFGEEKSSYLAKLSDRKRRFVWLVRRTTPELAKKVRADEFEGVIQLNEPKRIYHYESVAGQLLGFTDVDNVGLSGVELQFDQRLRGTNGYVIMQRDGLGRRRPSVDYPRVEPVNGNNITLTIDLEYQSIAESELRKGIERNKAASGLVVMLEPSTGAILAMANYPGMDPNKVEGVDPQLFKNRAITDMFEPGSVFKIVAASAAIENSLLKLNQKFFAENGSYTVRFAGGPPRIINDTHPHGMLTFQEAIEQSSNIVVAKVSDLIGAERLYKTARNYGFGIATGVELPGEVNGELKKPNHWSGATLNSMAIGYEVGVTPLQIAAAYAAVANSGALMKPFIVRQQLNQYNEVLAETHPVQIRKIVTKHTAQTLTKLFEAVVENGTGISARHERVPVAGKTGTSRKFVDGKYEIGNYTASFVGFLPADDPKLVCLIMLDHPKEGGYTGGLASAPIFKSIVDKIVASSSWMQKPEPVTIAGKRPIAVPDVTGLDAGVATSMLAGGGFEVQQSGNGRVVLRQSPSPGTRILPGASVRISTNEGSIVTRKGLAVVPDVRRMTIRRAINRLTMENLDVKISGSGVVVAQIPAPGQHVQPASRVLLRCEPRSIGVVALSR